MRSGAASAFWGKTGQRMSGIIDIPQLRGLVSSACPAAAVDSGRPTPVRAESMTPDSTADPPAFLSTATASERERRLALAVALACALACLATAPFAKVKLAPVWAFIPIYQSAVVVNDLITAVLLFGQFAILRSWGLLVLAGGYVFTGLLAAVHALTFPGLFAPGGLLGAGPQTTAWLYMFWHGGFPLFVIAYARLRSAHAPLSAKRRRAAEMSGAVAAVVAIAGGFTLLATAGQDLLPSIMEANHYTPVMIGIVTGVWLLSLVALAVLWRSRPHSVLDVWLMVTMCAWVFDIALAAVLNAGRFDVGFYAGRIYGLLAASVVLLVLLLEHGMLYARLTRAYEVERRERRLVEEKTAELTEANRDLESFSYSVSHDLRAPLRAVTGYARMLSESHAAVLDAEGRRLLGVVLASGREMGALIDGLLAFARLGRAPLRTRSMDLEEVARRVVEELRAICGERRVEFSVGALGRVQGDPVLLKQVLANLVGNAVKFSRDRDPAVIEIDRLDRLEPDDADAWFVRDNGAGFDMRYAGKLFQVFERMHTADEYEGTGVGLAIVQRVVSRHGGRVWADAAPGAGATFCFTLGPGDHSARARLTRGTQ